MNIYVPDDLAEQVKSELGDTNISQIAQAALRDELLRVQALAKLTADEEGFERVEANNNGAGQPIEVFGHYPVAFRGKKIAHDYEDQTSVYLTPKGALAVVEGTHRTLIVYKDWRAFLNTIDEVEGPFSYTLYAQVALALGEKPPVEELDI